MNSELLTIDLPMQSAQAWQQVQARYPSVTTVLNPTQQSQLQMAVGLSDFVLRSTLQWPEQIITLFTKQQLAQPEAVNYQQLFLAQFIDIPNESALYQALRCFRTQQLVGIAIADLVLQQPLAWSLVNLSSLADTLITQALAWLTQYYQQKWGEPVNHQGIVQPLLVYGMGKLGGKELNFSSDIDLIFAYPESGQTRGAQRCLDNQQFFTRLAQKLITALQQTTQDGFVYRVDMRLRPFGESGPLVMSFNAMEDYYQQQGRDWERYAMLKARLLGDSAYHQQLSTMLRPFVYRRYIDFSVIDSLRRMKLLIAQEVRRKNLHHNIKLGAGGIREVEFIVQVFQLLRGGQLPDLQQRNLLTVLPILVTHQVINQESAEVLNNAYCFLRRVENIIQAFDDQQTQTLPEDTLSQQRLLAVLNLATWHEFMTLLEQYMAQVHAQFNVLIGEEISHGAVPDHDFSMLWLQSEHWQIDELNEWFACHASLWQAEPIMAELVSFKQAIDKRLIGQRGRVILDKLMPVVLWQIYQQQGHEATLARVITVLDNVSTRTAYLELLLENEGALKHLIRLCKASPWVSEHLAKYPILLDELIDPSLFKQLPQLTNYAQELALWLLRVNEDDLEAQMTCLRQFKQAQHLRIAVADIVGVLPVEQVSDHLTAVAEAIIEQVIHISWQQMAIRFGEPNSTLGQLERPFAVLGYGKLGGQEMSYSSDLDLVFLHQTDPADTTNGAKPISVGKFYGKLVQRMMHIFNTRMVSGVLYELDMRLRPSGNAGLLVIHIDSFGQYQQTEAWTWEHQALVRARMIYGNAAMKLQFQHIKQQVLAKHRALQTLTIEVLQMRDKMRTHLDRSTATALDIKHGKGGLVDIEFICQYLVLHHSKKHHELACYADNIRLFNQLVELAILTKQQGQGLIDRYCYLRDLGHQLILKQVTSHVLEHNQLTPSSVVVDCWKQLFEAQ